MNKVSQPAAFHEIIDIRYTIWQHNYQNKHCVCCGKMHIRIIPLDYQQVPQYLFINWHNLLSTYLKLYLGKEITIFHQAEFAKKTSPILKPQDAQTNQTALLQHIWKIRSSEGKGLWALCTTNSSPSLPSAISSSCVFLCISPPLLLQLSGPTGKAVSRRCAYMLKGVKNELLAVVAQQTVFHSALILSESEQFPQRKLWDLLDMTNNRLTSHVTKPVFP